MSIRLARAGLARAGTVLLLAVTLLFAADPTPARAQAPSAGSDPVRVTIVHFSDTDQMAARDGAGGLAEATTILRRLRAENPHTLLTFGGDMISPSLLSGFDRGRHMVALTGAMGVDVAVLGNHEFDFGPEVAARRLAESPYPWLGANVRMDGRDFPGVAPSFIRTVAGYRIGFLGVITERARETSSAGPTVAFLPPIPAAHREALALRAAGAEIVIGLCHLEYTTELRLLREVPEIDICLSGDDHVGFLFYDGRQLALESGANLAHLAVLDLHLSRLPASDGTRVVWRPEMRLVSTAGVAPDPEMAARVAVHAARLDATLDVAIGTAGVDLDTRRATVRTREAPFANLLADAMRRSTGAAIALADGGGIRADRIYPAGHRITRRDIHGELPFGNVVVVLRVTGAQLRQALENGVSQVEEAAGRFPQVSGLAFDYDPRAPAGQRVGQVTVASRPLDPAATYTLATNDFLARGGDGYTMFRDAPRVVGARGAELLATALMDHVEALGTVAPVVEGRIVAR